MSALQEEIRAVVAPLIEEAMERLAERLAQKDEPLIDTDEAARRLGVTPQTIRRKVARGELPVAKRIGQQMRFNPADLV